MTTLFTIIGVIAVGWWVFGVCLSVFACQTYMHPKAPLSARIYSLWAAGWAMPGLLLTNFSLPTIVVMPVNQTPDDEAAFEEWRQANCNCPACKAQRGEA